ncbi:MAG: aldo/keto reductase, partial [Planctomycetaceae bacterium]|nr:aldo/keto reductase [Planctomycetaceae bacterium]
GTAVIPKTSQPKRLLENISVFDFSLSADQMLAISKLNEGRRFNDPGDFCEQAFNTFYPIYE